MFMIPINSYSFMFVKRHVYTYTLDICLVMWLPESSLLIPQFECEIGLGDGKPKFNKNSFCLSCLSA